MSTSINSYLAIQINSLRIQLDKNRFSRTQLKNSKNDFNFSTSFQNVSFHLNACGIGCKYSETDLSRETSNNEIPLLKPSPSFFSDSCKRRSPILSETQTNLNISRGESSNLLQIKSQASSTSKFQVVFGKRRKSLIHYKPPKLKRMNQIGNLSIAQRINTKKNYDGFSDTITKSKQELQLDKNSTSIINQVSIVPQNRLSSTCFNKEHIEKVKKWMIYCCSLLGDLVFKVLLPEESISVFDLVERFRDQLLFSNVDAVCITMICASPDLQTIESDESSHILYEYEQSQQKILKNFEVEQRVKEFIGDSNVIIPLSADRVINDI